MIRNKFVGAVMFQVDVNLLFVSLTILVSRAGVLLGENAN